MGTSYADVTEQRKKIYDSEISLVETHNILKSNSKSRNILFNMNNLHFQNVTKSFNVNIINKFVSISIGTTGLDALKDEIIEICAVKYFEFKPIEKFHTYVKPSKSITLEQEEKCNIKNEQLNEYPTIKEIMNDFEEYVKNIPIVCYNANFVMKFLYVNGLNIVNDKKIKLYDVISIYKKAFDKHETLPLAFKNLMKFEYLVSTESNSYATAKVFEKCIYLLTEDDDKFFERNVMY